MSSSESAQLKPVLPLVFTREQLVMMRQGLLLQVKVIEQILWPEKFSCTEVREGLESPRKFNRQ